MLCKTDMWRWVGWGRGVKPDHKTAAHTTVGAAVYECV